MKEYTVKVYDNGTKYWYLNGEQVTKEEHKRRTSKATVEIDGIKYKLEEV